MKPTRNTDLLVKDGEGAVIISTHDGLCRAATLNTAGYWVWLLIDGERDVSAIVSELMLAGRWGASVEREELEHDVWSFLENLREEGFVDMKE